MHVGKRLCSISGMGGVGKTELAIQYARQHEADYPGGICWLTVRESNLANEIVQFFLLHIKINKKDSKEFDKIRSSDHSLKQQVKWCWQHWQPSEGLVLVVLDDVTDLGSCREILLASKRFHVLMTTRQRGLDSNVFELPLDPPSLKEAMELLTTLEGEGRVQQELQTAKELCEWLGCLPLGLELVGRYLKKDPDLSLAEMLERLEAEGLQDEALDPSEQQMQQTFSTAPRGVRAAFELSWRELAPISQLVGQFLSSFKPTVIPWELVTFSSDIQLLNWANTDIKLAKQQLYSLYLIQRLEEREACYKMHSLIREFLQYKMAASEQADARKATFSLAIKEYDQKLACEMLKQEHNLKEIEEEVAEEFEELEFSERWHPEMDRADLDDITVTVDCVKIIKKTILDIDNIDEEYSQVKYEIDLEIVFTPEGSYPDPEMCYSDPDDGELVYQNTITGVGEQQSKIVTAKVELVFDANDPLGTNGVEGVELVGVPTEVEIKPVDIVDIKMSLDFEDFE